jgi:hypothetical protein
MIRTYFPNNKITGVIIKVLKDDEAEQWKLAHNPYMPTRYYWATSKLDGIERKFRTTATV